MVWILRKGNRIDELKNRIHPTQKPVGLFCNILNDYTDDNEKVCDPYLGSGNILIACEKLNRICYGMEIEPYYCDMIVNRYMNWCTKNKRECVIKLND